MAVNVVVVLKTGAKFQSPLDVETLTAEYFTEKAIFKLCDNKAAYFLSGDRIDYIVLPKESNEA